MGLGLQVFEARIFRPNSLAPSKAPELVPKERQVSMVEGKKWFCVPTQVEDVNPSLVPDEVIVSQRAYIRNGKKVRSLNLNPITCTSTHSNHP